ncbi:hypothetical protein CKO28_21900 [Rhodovibrio sodomensis]|uniref:Uncharacterized protein n=1 Tax=Rhodovibrio sodomensis TaxID=1088 RepID=A0ABS1DJN4_9PROT|nr:PcfJ domain-containing protein [Rhodovibrio sodomensis]MBK1670677.1 hypothetical protein [Rhodovibrio sodomensis]
MTHIERIQAAIEDGQQTAQQVEHRTDYAPERYGFVETIARRYGLKDEAAIETAKERYAGMRARSWRKVFAPGELGQGSGAAMVSAMPSFSRGFFEGGSARSIEINIAFVTREGLLQTLGVMHEADDLDLPLVDQLGIEGSVDRIRDAIDHGRGRSPELKLNAFSSQLQRNCGFMANDLARETFRGLAFPDVKKNLAATKAMAAVVQRFETRRMVGQMGKFIAHLDEEAIYLMRRAGIYDREAYNWLVGSRHAFDLAEDDLAEDAAKVSQYRRQAMRYYPLFAHRMSRGGVPGIDEGQSVPRVLADSYGKDVFFMDEDFGSDGSDDSLSERDVARLHGLTWQRAGREVAHEPIGLARDLGRVPANWLPKSRKDFAAFRTVMDNVNGLHRATGADEDALVRETGGRWQDWAARFEGNPAEGVRDLVNAFQKSVLYPIAVQAIEEAGIPTEHFGADKLRQITGLNPSGPIAHADNQYSPRTVEVLFGTKGMSAIMEASKRWHQELPRLNAALQDPKVVGAVSWAPLTEAWTAPNGCTLEPILNEAGLKEEGRAMKHCVGGYTHACTRDCHVLSLKGPKGQRLTTLEIRDPRGRDGKFKLVQNYGPGNSTAPKEAKAAAEAYLRHLQALEKERAIDWGGIREGRERARKEMEKKGKLAAEVGFDLRDKQRSEAAFQLYRRYMTGPARKAQTLDQFLDQTGLRKALTEGAVENAWQDRLEQRRDRASFRKSERQGQRRNRAGQPRSERIAPPQITAGFSELSAAEYARFTPVQQARTNAVILVPGEGLLAKVEPQSGLTVEARADRMADALRERAQGVSGVFARAKLADMADRVIVAPSVEEARAARQVAMQAAGRTRQDRQAITGLAPNLVGRPDLRERYRANEQGVDLTVHTRKQVLAGIDRLHAALTDQRPQRVGEGDAR